MSYLPKVLCRLGAALSLFMSKGALAAMVAIVHPTNPLSEIDQPSVRRIWLGKDTFYRDGKAIVPLDVDLKSPVRRHFLKVIIDKSDAEFRQYWSRIVFTGKGTPPRNVGGDREVVEWVAKDPLAIGLVDESAVNSSVKKIMQVD